MSSQKRDSEGRALDDNQDKAPAVPNDDDALTSDVPATKKKRIEVTIDGDAALKSETSTAETNKKDNKVIAGTLKSSNDDGTAETKKANDEAPSDSPKKVEATAPDDSSSPPKSKDGATEEKKPSVEPELVLQLDEPDGKPSQPKESQKELTTCTIVVFGLHPRISKEPLETFLQEFGTIKLLNLKRAFGSSYCQCEFETIAHAQTAFEALNERKLMGKQLFVKPM
jgi:RNA recognition motif-containing protein